MMSRQQSRPNMTKSKGVPSIRCCARGIPIVELPRLWAYARNNSRMGAWSLIENLCCHYGRGFSLQRNLHHIDCSNRGSHRLLLLMGPTLKSFALQEGSPGTYMSRHALEGFLQKQIQCAK